MSTSHGLYEALSPIIVFAIVVSPSALIGQGGRGADANATQASFGFVMAPAAPDNQPQVGPTFRVGADVTPPGLIDTTEAWYPDAARNAGIAGLVVIEGVVRGDGSLGNLKVTESLDTLYGLDSRALDAVKQWLFVPGRWHGQPVSVATMFVVEFGPRVSNAPPPAAGAFGKNAHRPRESNAVAPAVLRRVTGLYVPEAMRARMTGDVRIEAVVGTDGRVSEARVMTPLDSNFGLDEVALQAARRWLFTPGTIDGRAVPMVVSIVEQFRVASSATSTTDRSVMVYDSYSDFTWTPLHWAPPLILALAGLVAGFSWAYRRHRARPLREQSGGAP
jgi:TonB family protein